MSVQPHSTVSMPRPTGVRRERILVIDDEENIRSTLEEFLSMNGYEVDTAENGAQGLDLLGRNAYDVVLSDLKMPGIDGIAVIEWVRETNPGLPVLVMSGHATVESTIRALRLGAYDYLLKPFGLDEIERTIENCLDKRRLERRNTELTEANERLREVERIKDDLLATVSHEFRTPLTALRGFLNLMEYTGLDNLRSDQLHALDAIGDNVERLDSMIANLLTLVEAHDGAYKPILEPVRFGDFLDEYFGPKDHGRPHRPLKREVAEAAANSELLLDRLRFPLVLTNLLDNAWKFSKGPGEAEVIFRARREGTSLIFEVHDDGIGIPASLGEQLFERFTQGDMTSTREYQGAGLGLAVVREIVTAHNGDVRLVPPLLSGASVRVTLPAVGIRAAEGDA
ncbi:MAG: hybrid sensor histidine kinase/response regulator [bacterium]